MTNTIQVKFIFLHSEVSNAGTFQA